MTVIIVQLHTLLFKIDLCFVHFITLNRFVVRFWKMISKVFISMLSCENSLCIVLSAEMLCAADTHYPEKLKKEAVVALLEVITLGVGNHSVRGVRSKLTGLKWTKTTFTLLFLATLYWLLFSHSQIWQRGYRHDQLNFGSEKSQGCSFKDRASWFWVVIQGENHPPCLKRLISL